MGGMFSKPKYSMPKSPILPDLTDQAVRMWNNNKNQWSVIGSRRSSILTGPLGDRTAVPTLQKSILGG